MKRLLRSKKNLFVPLILTLLLTNYGCQKDYEPPANLSVNSIFITQTDYTPYLDYPPNISVVLPSDFDLYDPSTWIGPVIPYIKHRYTYTVQFHVTNSGKGTAYDSELDVGYFYDSGWDEFDTFYLGDIPSYGERMKTVEVVSVNRELEECGAEVYWYDSEY
jgi:hypothetical protein